MRVLISGGGVAGLSLAYWLSRIGCQPTLVERTPSLRQGGYAIDIRGVAMTVADRMGIGDQVRGAVTGMRGASVVDGRGRVLARVKSEHVLGSPGDVEVKRGDLTRILFEATRHDTEYRLGDSIATMRDEADGVRVTFENGAPETYDLVMGADGLHSTVRRLVFGPEAHMMHHLGYYVSIFTVPDRPGVDSSALMYNVPGKLAGIYHSRNSTQAILAFASRRLIYDYRDSDAQMRILEDTFSGEGWETARLLTEMRDAPDFYFDEVSQIRLKPWSRGRVALVGDAAYCASFLSGQGTSLAMVGAYVLATDLAATSGDHQRAFSRYEDRMRDFVRANQKIAESGASLLIPANRTQMWVRNGVMHALPYLPKLRVFNRKLEIASTAITLPDLPLPHPPTPTSVPPEALP